MKKAAAESYRDIDFSGARRGPAVRPEPGKTKISIYQTLINEALLEYVHRHSTLDLVRQVVREELAPYARGRRSNFAVQRPGTRVARSGR